MEEIGILPPQAIELEEAVLGAIMLENEALQEVFDILNPDDFYKNSHKTIFKIMVQMGEAGNEVDLLTLVQKLKELGLLEDVGGAYSLSQLTNKIGSSINVEAHARIVKQKSIARKVIKAANEAIRQAYDDAVDVFDLLNNLDVSINDITNDISTGSVVQFSKVVSEIEKDWNDRKDHGIVTGVPTGFLELDLLTGGFSPGQLIILAARPGMGKTTIALNAAKNAALQKKRIGIITLEMTAKELAAKIISSESRVDYRRILSQSPTEGELLAIGAGISELNSSGLFFVDRSAMSDLEFKIECRRLVRHHQVDEIWVDYLQLMHCKEKKINKEQEISTISRTMKSTAKALNVPIVALSQLSREVEKRGGDKRPQLSDLRDSGAIEQDADMVIFAYRPEYYDIKEDEGGNSTEGLLELMVEKHRGGSTGDITLHCNLRYSIIEERKNQNKSF